MQDQFRPSNFESVKGVFGIVRDLNQSENVLLLDLVNMNIAIFK